VVEPGQRDQLDELRLGPVRAQGGPQRVVHPGPVVEGVHQAEEQALAIRERVRFRLGRAGGGDLGRGQAHPLREEGHVDAPLVLGPAAGARAVDDDLPLAQADGAPVEQAARHHAQEDALVHRQGAEQGERRDARRHDPVERGLDRRGVGGLEGGDAGLGHGGPP